MTAVGSSSHNVPDTHTCHPLVSTANPKRRIHSPSWILIQIQLMISLRIPPLPRLQYLRRDRLALPPLLLGLLRHLPRRLLLLRGMVEYRTPVLRPRVGALPIFGRGVVHLVEEFEEGGVGETGGVKGHLECFGICVSLAVSQSRDRMNGSIWTRGKRVKITYVPFAPYTRHDNSGYWCRHQYTPPSHHRVPCRQSSSGKMLNTPEAAGGDGTFLSGFGNVLNAAFCGTKAHSGRGGEGAEQAGDEVGHQGSHNEGEDGEDKSLWRELQFEGLCLIRLYRRTMGKVHAVSHISN